jgi:predicted transcriptional regulator
MATPVKFIERKKARESFKHEALASWAAYQETGLHLTGQEVRAWLNGGAEEEMAPPKCPE